MICYYYYAKFIQDVKALSDYENLDIFSVIYSHIGRTKPGEEQFSLQYLKPETIGKKEQFVEALQAPQQSTRMPSDPGRPVWNCSKYLSGGGGGGEQFSNHQQQQQSETIGGGNFMVK